MSAPGFALPLPLLALVAAADPLEGTAATSSVTESLAEAAAFLAEPRAGLLLARLGFGLAFGAALGAAGDLRAGDELLRGGIAGPVCDQTRSKHATLSSTHQKRERVL